MTNKDPGYVYILTNPSFREDWVKIGKSRRPVDVRSKELDNTAVPLPLEIFATIKTVKFNEVEKLVHKTIDRLTDFRIRQNREFFNVPPQMALDIFRDIEQKNVTYVILLSVTSWRKTMILIPMQASMNWTRIQNFLNRNCILQLKI